MHRFWSCIAVTLLLTTPARALEPAQIPDMIVDELTQEQKAAYDDILDMIVLTPHEKCDLNTLRQRAYATTAAGYAFTAYAVNHLARIDQDVAGGANVRLYLEQIDAAVPIAFVGVAEQNKAERLLHAYEQATLDLEHCDSSSSKTCELVSGELKELYSILAEIQVIQNRGTASIKRLLNHLR